jgi:hypothetical protein
MMLVDESRAYVGVTRKEFPYDGTARIIYLIEKPALDHAFTADIAESSAVGAHESSKGVLGPTLADKDTQTSQFVISVWRSQTKRNWVKDGKGEPI